MKTRTLFAILNGLVAASLVSGMARANTERHEVLYQKWNETLAAHPFLTEPMWFSTNGPQALSEVVTDIKDNQVAFAHFLCERIANATGPVSYTDAKLLIEVAGIDLLHDEKPGIEQDIAANLVKFTAQFREKWRQGIYKDPSERIKRIYEQQVPKMTSGKADSNELIGIRRYGIFGLPELVRQIRQHNSKHAFAAYLIITGQRYLYVDYLEHTDEQFTTTEAKLQHVRSQFERMEASEGAGDFEITKRISSALAE